MGLLIVNGLHVVSVESISVFAAQSLLSPFEAERKIPDFSMAAVGDMGCSPVVKKIISDVDNKMPKLILVLGDLSYQGNNANCWLSIVSPIYSKLKIVLGEHDYRSGSVLKQYKNQFNLSQDYYSFNYQNVHFIALATEIQFDINSPQYNFIKNDLDSNSKNPEIKWIVVFSYRPQYSSPTKHQGNVDLRDLYHPLFQKYHVDIVLQAHNHNYQRTYPVTYNQKTPVDPIIEDNNSNYYEGPNGQIYLTVGTGGAELYRFSGKAPYIAAQYAGFGFLDISIANNGRNLTGTYYNSDNSIKDHFIVRK